MSKKNQELLDNIDSSLKMIQAQFVGPKFRYKNFPDTEAFKEFDSKRIISTSNLKRHFFVTLLLIWFPILAAPFVIVPDSNNNSEVALMFICWIVILAFWLFMWLACSRGCTYKDCQARRTFNYHLKISEKDKGVVGTFSETTTDKNGVKTTVNYANREYLEVWQCACCKREFQCSRITKETV